MRSLLTVLFCLAVATAASAQSAVTGVVRDETGGVVAGAVVQIRGPLGLEQQAVTGTDGRFAVTRSASTAATVVVRAGGFAEATQPVGTADLQIVLSPARVSELVTVTPTRTEQRLGDVPASVNIIDRAAIRQSPAVVIDDVLRLVPTFSLFRRSSSLSSHPTAQGVSLRGIGPSGVSRSLVLIDGVPFNDPFGGWVYWTRVPLETVERIEVVDGTSSSAYGNYAIGGVINVVSSRPKPRTAELRTQWGNHDSPKADFFASDVWGRVGASVEGSMFKTNGFPILRAVDRGPVDTAAKLEYQNFAVKLDAQVTDRVNLFFRTGYFKEERDNAKVTTVGPIRPEANDTEWKSASGGARITLPDSSDLQARVFLDWNTFHSNFMAVPNPTTRAIGRMTLLQEVPTEGVGAMAQWSKAFATEHLFTVVTDLRHVDGASMEQALDPTLGATVTLTRDAGGTQMSSGTSVQWQFFPTSRVNVTMGGRVDHWNNYNARNLETTVSTGLPTAASRTLPERADTVFSPRVAALLRAHDRVTVWGSLGSGFRAPTLNELYRQFRVGLVVTQANDQLGPERLLGGELGVNIAATTNLTFRSTWFDNRVENPVSNVTIATNVQRRQNLGRTRIWGWQNDVEYRIGSQFRVAAAYVYNQAKVEEFAANPSIVGKFLPQVPEHRGSVSLAYTNPRAVDVSVSVLGFGRQFNEDNNLGTVPGESAAGLPGYTTVEMTVLRRVTRNLDVFFGAQNLFDTEYYVGLSPTTIGSPRLVNGGLRVSWSGR